MTDYIHLSGTTLWGEPCAQLGSEDYPKNSRIEAHTYIRQLQRVFGGNPDGTRFVLVKCPHEFGTYLDIKFFYYDEDQRHVIYMNNVEAGCEKWDDQAKKELAENDERDRPLQIKRANKKAVKEFVERNKTKKFRWKSIAR